MLIISRGEMIDCILEYIKDHKKECLTEDKTYFLSKEKIIEIIKEGIEHTAWYNFDMQKTPKDELEKEVSKKAQECIVCLKSNDSYKVTEEGIEVKAPLWKAVVENKHSIAIKTIKDNAVELVFAGVLFGGVAAILTTVGVCMYINSEEANNYSRSKFITDSGQYNLSDIYVVYDVNNTYFCTRNLVKIKETDSVDGNFRYGTGNVGEYYYRDDIYDYYDVQTGNRICQDHEDGFYVEKLTDFYTAYDMKKVGYSISISDVEDKINNDYLLSREPEIRRK